MNEYDLIVLGAGPGGYVAGLYAAQHGLKTCLIEKNKLGGVCLNVGCIPAKTLSASARLLAEIKEADKLGIKVNGFSADLSAIFKRKNDIVNKLRQGIEGLLKARKVDLKLGFGRLADKGTIEVNGELLKAKHIIIATGSRPLELPIMRFDKKCIICSDEMLDVKEGSERVAIVGGGAIGCEFASIFNEFGNRVTIIEMMENLIPANDQEIAKRLEAALKRKGIEVLTKTKVKSFSMGKEKDLVLDMEGVAPRVLCDRVLVCVGRRPNIEGIGLEDIGVEMSASGIKVDKYLRTNVQNIFAAGDVIGGYMYAHVATYEGILACDNILGKRRQADYSAVPACIFTNPDIASVGINEAEARKKGIDVDIARFHFRSLGKAHALGKIDGMIKIVSAKPDNKIIGVDIIGEAASEIIAEATLAIKMAATLEDLTHTIHAHPTMSEVVLEASHAGLKKPIHSL